MDKDHFLSIYENPARNLNNVTRYSGVFCMKKESNGYHVIDMMGICLYIFEEARSRFNINLDIRDLTYRCYIHDLDEVLTGDIQRNIKYYNDSIYQSISEVTEDIMNNTYSDVLVEDIRGSKNVNEINGLIVKVADTLQSSLKIYEEVNLNNFHFNKLIKEHSGFVRKLKGIIENSECRHDGGRGELVTDLLMEVVDDFYNHISSEISKINNK